MEPAPESPDRLVPPHELCHRLGLSHATLYRRVLSGALPRAIKTGRKSGWPEAIVKAIECERAAKAVAP
jgi:predicted DNA-binding transcriptional regulator AlpA